MASENGLPEGLASVAAYEGAKAIASALGVEDKLGTGKCKVSPPSFDSLLSGFQGVFDGAKDREEADSKSDDKQDKETDVDRGNGSNDDKEDRETE